MKEQNMMPKVLKHGITEVAEATKSLYLWAKILGVLITSAALFNSSVRKF